MCPKLLNLQKKQEIHLFAHETSPLCVVTLHRGLCTRVSNWKCYSLVRLLLSSLSRWASRGQWQRLAVQSYRTIALPPSRVVATQTKVVSVRWDQVTLVFASYFRAAVSNWWWIELWEKEKTQRWWYWSSWLEHLGLPVTREGDRRRNRWGGVGWGGDELGSEQIKFEGL